MQAATIVAAPIRLQYFTKLRILRVTCLKMAVCCVRIDEERTKSVILNCIQTLGYSELKTEQLKVIMEFLRGRDVFAILPTGFGKTLCYVCLPLIFDKLTRTASSIILVVTPLNAIMKDQVCNYVYAIYMYIISSY